MRTFITLTTVVAVAALTAAFTSNSAREDERQAVERAVLDYVEGVYECKPEYIERSVHKKLAKVGYMRRGEDTEYVERHMTQPELVALAKEYNKDGRVPADAPKKVEILDVLDQTAAVKLTAHWGIDYMQLAKIEGRWTILQVLWQTHP